MQKRTDAFQVLMSGRQKKQIRGGELNCASLALRVFASQKFFPRAPPFGLVFVPAFNGHKKTALSRGFFSSPSGVPTGIRTPVLGMKIQCPRPG